MSFTVDTVAARRTALDRDAARTGRWRLLLVLAGVEAVVLFAPTVSWLIDRWTLSVWQNAHGMFVPPLSAWLAWHALKGRADLPVRGSAWGFAFLVPALGLHALDAGMHTQLLSAFALCLAMPGFALLLLGTARTRLIAFPLAFLFFALPIPLGFTEPLQLTLRHLVANSTAALLPLFGVTVFLEGTTINTPTGVVQIADACSGFSTLTATITVACLVAYTARSRGRRAVVLMAAVPVAFAANLLRVLALSLMVAWGGAWLLDTFVHPLSGMLTFALALPVIFWLGESKGGGTA